MSIELLAAQRSAIFETMRRLLLHILLAAACGIPSTVLAAVDLGEARSAFVYVEASVTPESQVVKRTDAPADFLTFTPATVESAIGTSISDASQRVEILLDNQNGVVAVHSSASGSTRSSEADGIAVSDTRLSISVVVSEPIAYTLTGTISASADPGSSELGLATAEVYFLESHAVGFGQAATVAISDGGTVPAGKWNLAARAFASANRGLNEASYDLVLTFASSDPCFAAGAIVGTEDGDALEGTTGDDVICGLGGDDLINGHGGADVIYGGDGDDVIVSGLSNEPASGGTFYGGDGNDRIIVANGNATVSGGPGRDRISGGDGDDTLEGDEGDDVIAGGPGADIIDGGPGNDFICGSVATNMSSPSPACGSLRRDRADTDTIDGGPGNDVIHGAGGADTITGGDGADFIEGNAGRDQIDGGFGKDRLRGGLGNDTIHGGPQRDVLRGGGGSDALFGDEGNDRLVARDNTADVTVDGGAGTDRARFDAELDTPVAIEILAPRAAPSDRRSARAVTLRRPRRVIASRATISSRRRRSARRVRR